MDTIGVSQTDFLSGEISMTFDLEKAREVCKTLPKYMNGACPCKEEAEAAKMLIKALPEIEQLREANTNFACQACDQAQEIERLQEFRDRVARILKQPLTDCDDLLILGLGARICQLRRQAAEIERLRAEISEQKGMIWKTQQVKKEQAAQIKSLEDALAEERAKVIMLIEKLQLVANDPDWQSKGLKHDFDWYLAESKKQIESGEPEDQRCRRLGEPNGWTDPEGKIGPDDSKKISHLRPYEVVAADLAGMLAKSWQITDEREEALHVMGNMKTLIVCPHCKTPIEFTDIPKYTAVLRAMIDSSGTVEHQP